MNPLSASKSKRKKKKGKKRGNKRKININITIKRKRKRKERKRKIKRKSHLASQFCQRTWHNDNSLYCSHQTKPINISILRSSGRVSIMPGKRVETKSCVHSNFNSIILFETFSAQQHFIFLGFFTFLSNKARLEALL